MVGLWQDVSHAVRRLSQRPAFTAVALSTLALGIGGATAIFSIADAVILRPLPYARADRLVVVWQSDRGRDQPFVELSYPEVRSWREQGGVLEDLAGMSSTNQSWVLNARGEPVNVVGRLVSWSFFGVLGVAPARGRTFAPEDDRRGAAPVVVLSHGLWRARFATNPAIIGQAIVLDRQPFTVVGVMPPGFAYPKGADLWLPLVPAVGELALNREVQWMIAVGRLRAGVRLEQARRDLDAAAARDGRGQSEAGMSVVLTPLTDAVLGRTRPTLLALLAAVGLVLLAASANVAGLQLVQTSERTTELAVRAALGASAGRLARALLVESAVLAAGGGLAGVLAAWLAIPALVALSPADVPRLGEASVDARTCVFALAAVGTTVALTALAPLLSLRRRSLRDSLHQLAPTVAGGRNRLTALLVVSQVAIAMVLLAGAALLARSFAELRRVPLGFDAERVLAVDAGLPEGRYDLRHERAYFEELIARVDALPGVQSAAAVTLRPLWGEVGMDWPFVVEGQSESDARTNPLLNFETVSPDYFRTLGIPLKRGRVFDERDRAGQPGVVVVSETLAKRYWPGQDPLGRRLRVPLPPTGYDNAWLTVVGVVGNARYRELTASRLDLYLSYRQSNHRLNHLLVRAHGEPAALASAVRGIVRSLAPDQPAPEVIAMADAVSEALAGPRFAARVFGSFAVVAMLLSVLGLYGVIARSVALRTREIGVRMSLGAGRTDIAGLVLRDGLRLAAAGALVGMAGAAAGTRLLSSLLFGVGATDPTTLASAAVLLLAAAALACLLPAQRAMSVQPAAALRQE